MAEDLPDTRVAVIGAGVMGSGIAQVAAQAGYRVLLHDLTEQALEGGLDAIHGGIDRLVAKQQLTEQQAQAALNRITLTTELAEAAEVQMVVEAVFERLEAKQEVFRALDAICADDVVLATNTSAIPITQIAAATQRPERVVGTHFFSPAPVMKLCELVRGYRTSDETLAAAREFAEQIGKTCLVVNRDVAGFVTTRLIATLMMEAARLVEAGVASAEDVDLACRLGFGHAMGPLATMDLTGLDVMVNAARNIYADTQDAQFFPPELLRRMVAAGDLGRKTGRGFYTYRD